MKLGYTQLAATLFTISSLLFTFHFRVKNHPSFCLTAPTFGGNP